MKRAYFLVFLVPLLAFSQELPCNADSYTPKWIALPNDVPQLIVIEFLNNDNLHENLKILLKRIYEKNDFSKLSELLMQ